MSDLKTVIAGIEAKIVATNLVTDWGGWCVNKTDKEMPYGIGTNNNVSGKLFGYNDNEITTGYLYVRNIESIGKFNQVEVTVTVNIFTPVKKIGENIQTFQVPLMIFGQLQKNYKNVRFYTPTSEKYSFQEMSSIDIKFTINSPCDISALNDPIC